MRVAEGHNAFYIQEADTFARAYIGAEAWGVNFRLSNIGRTATNYVTFGINPEDGHELSGQAEHLIDLVPADINEVIAEKEAKARQIEKDTGYYWFRGPGAPMVHDVEQTDSLHWRLMGASSGDLHSTTDKELGGLSWSDSPREQLVVRVDEVNALIFRPEAFRLFATIAANKPEFPKRASIWGRTVK